MTQNAYSIFDMQLPYYAEHPIVDDCSVKLPPISNILAASRIDTQPTVDTDRMQISCDQNDLCTMNPQKNVKFELDENSA